MIFSRFLCRQAVYVLVVFSVFVILPPASADEDGLNVPPAGFVALFNGQDLTGWKGLVADPEKRAQMSREELQAAQKIADERMQQHWTVKDGVIVFDGKGNNLCTVKDYENFELLVDWKIEKDGDSGIYLRGSPQVQIWESKLGSGGIYNNQKNPSNPLINADNPVGQWNTFRIKLIGNRVTVYLNDKLVVSDVIMENYWNREKLLYPVGAIELQNHGNTLYFRNIFVRELPGSVALFNGKDLDGFEPIGGKADSWKVVDGAIQSGGAGGGWLSSERQYSDFELYLEYRVPKDGNSGVFLRTPREGNPAYAGMEVQVLDDYADMYKDLKEWQFTGSVYGVEPPAKRVTRKANEWQSMVIRCCGPRVRVALNDEVIVDTDVTGYPDKFDPHSGLLSRGGYLGFQAHDGPVEYRMIRLRDLTDNTRRRFRNRPRGGRPRLPLRPRKPK